MSGCNECRKTEALADELRQIKRAVDFAAEQQGINCGYFLDLYIEKDWDAIRQWYPDFDLTGLVKE